MVIVVPSFTHRDQRKQKVVTAVVAGVIPLRSVHVRQGIDRASAVNQCDGRNEEAPDQHLRAVRPELRRIHFQHLSKSEHRKPGDRWNENVEAVQKPQLGILGKVGNAFQAGRKMRL